MMTPGAASGPPKAPLLRDPRFRSLVTQVALCVLLAAVVWLLVEAARANLARTNVASGFGFWNVTAGFDISQTLIDYSSSASTYGRAFWVGLMNTLLVAAIGIVLATIVGFTVGIARLSTNWLVSHLAAGYVQLIRNVPLLLQLLFWYNAVLKALPDYRDSVHLPGGGYLNNRGLYLPAVDFGGAGGTILAALGAGIVIMIVLVVLARRGRIAAGLATGLAIASL